jgi:hypothetical protein
MKSCTLLNPKATCGQHNAFSVCTGLVTDSKSIGRSPTLYSHLSTLNMCIEGSIRRPCKANCLNVSSVEAEVPQCLIYNLALYETTRPYYIDPLTIGGRSLHFVSDREEGRKSVTLFIVPKLRLLVLLIREA